MILLVRHGQTEWNAEKRVQCFLDSPLTSMGMNQAKRAVSFFDAYGNSSSIRIIVTHQLTHPQNQIFVLNDDEISEYQA